MAKEYLEKLSPLIEKATSDWLDDVHLECKHFFSGAALYAEGRICISLTPIGLAIKLPEHLRNELLKQKGIEPLRYFPKGPIKKDYVILPKTMINDFKIFRRWVKESIEYVLTLPKPTKKKRIIH